MRLTAMAIFHARKSFGEITFLMVRSKSVLSISMRSISVSNPAISAAAETSSALRFELVIIPAPASETTIPA